MISHRSSLGRGRRGRQRMSAVAAAAALAAGMLIAAGPASADLTPGTGWTKASLPAGYSEYSGERVPVSCVPGTQFCLAVVSNTDTIYGDVVTTDGGQTWHGYNALPATLSNVVGISCASTSECWLVGTNSNTDAPEAAETTDGGQTWTDQSPADWTDDFLVQNVDCPTTANCWIVGWDQNLSTPSLGDTPWVANTTDGGATWTTFTNLPTVTGNPLGTYQLYGISCVSTLSCLVTGGYNGLDGFVQAVSTTDGGDTWTLSTDPALAGLQDVFSASCQPTDGGLPVCYAVGAALLSGGPVEITSTDGGATWTGMETYDNTGWFSSISCADGTDCWAQGAGTSVALVGTSDGGASWSAETADTTNENGLVSCGTASSCVSTADGAIWYTTDDGGLLAAPVTSPLGTGPASPQPGHRPISRSLPQVSGSVVWARTGHSVTLTGQYQGNSAPKTAAVVLTLPNKSQVHRTVPIGLNNYYSVTIGSVAPGTTKVTFTAGANKPVIVRVHSHPSAAPVVTDLSTHAGSVNGGTTVTVTGKNFGRVSNVLFGTKAGTHVKVDSATKLTVRAPAGRGDGFLTVVTSGGGPSSLTGKAVYNWLQAPEIAKLKPSSGQPAGGTTVIVRGKHFSFVRAVYFGQKRGIHVVVLSPTELMVVAPAGRGKVDVRVITPGGETARVTTDRFSY